MEDVVDLEDCKVKCRKENACKGVKYDGGLKKCHLHNVITGLQVKEAGPGQLRIWKKDCSKLSLHVRK